MLLTVIGVLFYVFFGHLLYTKIDLPKNDVSEETRYIKDKLSGMEMKATIRYRYDPLLQFTSSYVSVEYPFFDVSYTYRPKILSVVDLSQISYIDCLADNTHECTVDTRIGTDDYTSKRTASMHLYTLRESLESTAFDISHFDNLVSWSNALNAHEADETYNINITDFGEKQISIPDNFTHTFEYSEYGDVTVSLTECSSKKAQCKGTIQADSDFFEDNEPIYFLYELTQYTTNKIPVHGTTEYNNKIGELTKETWG